MQDEEDSKIIIARLRAELAKALEEMLRWRDRALKAEKESSRN